MAILNSQRPDILIFGKNGQVGFELCQQLSSLNYKLSAVGSEDCDCCDKNSIIKTLDANNPTVIINAAAYTKVDKAESEKKLAYKVNADAPEIISAWARRHGAMMIHYSTDYVFNGEKRESWTENDTPAPLNIYGASKLQGDLNIQNSNCDYLIFRTSWVFGARGNNFYLTMRNLLQKEKEISVINDQFGAPTWSGTVADVTIRVLNQIYSPNKRADLKKISGIYNLTNCGETTWFTFAQKIREGLQKEMPNQLLANIIPISSNEYPSIALRPKNSSLSLEKLKTTFGIEPPGWREVLLQLQSGGL